MRRENPPGIACVPGGLRNLGGHVFWRADLLPRMEQARLIPSGGYTNLRSIENFRCNIKKKRIPDVILEKGQGPVFFFLFGVGWLKISCT